MPTARTPENKKKVASSFRICNANKDKMSGVEFERCVSKVYKQQKTKKK